MSQSSQPRAKNYKLPCRLVTRRTHRVDTNMKVSEFKAIKSRELLIVESYGKNGGTVTVLALKALINTI